MSVGADLLQAAYPALAAVGDSQTASQLIARLRAATSALGADRSFFNCFIHDRDAFDSYRLLLACEPSWGQAYEAHRCHLADPWLEYAKRHSQPVRGSEISAQGDDEQRTLELARQHGFESTLVVPAPAPGQLTRSGVLVLAVATDHPIEPDRLTAVRFLARTLALEVQDRLTDVLRREMLATCRLTSRDLTFLRLERDGVPTKAICRRINTSIQAVDTRFKRLNSRLGVSSRRDAARLAAEYGLI